MPDANTRWVLGALALLAGLILHQGAATRAQIDQQGAARLDDLRADMQGGFARLDGGLDGLQADMQDGFARLDGGLDDLRADMQGGFARLDIGLDGLDAACRPSTTAWTPSRRPSARSTSASRRSSA